MGFLGVVRAGQVQRPRREVSEDELVPPVEDAVGVVHRYVAVLGIGDAGVVLLKKPVSFFVAPVYDLWRFWIQELQREFS
ncbi:hypothetical protein A3K92_08640 [Thermococcus gorgonarius]|uniref:Uncharacterized protein n=2 Tax=Thermococcus gorgonarius TaxID=71997 RepID=A0A2Z2MGE4_THEGO|nr:hypothetical protein A3K92_08640 [Thermococcus gorgonarius]